MDASRPALTRRRIETAIAAVIAFAAGAVGLARQQVQVGPKRLALQRVARFDEPTQLAQPPKEDDLLFVTERHGTVRIVRSGNKLARPFLNIRGLVSSEGAGTEQGLLSLAFAPDYPSSGLFYVAYTDRGGDLRVDEFSRQPTRPLQAAPSSRRNVLTIDLVSTQPHGGLLLFGPDDLLYIGVADGGPSGGSFDSAQDTHNLLGTILRIDPRADGDRPYSTPPDNPFVGRPGRDEIYAYGLRDPWRFSFDRATGALAIADVGLDRFEEIDLLPPGRARGANFGWPGYEGYAVFNPGLPRRRAVFPVLAYPHGPGCSVVGGYVVRDPRLTRIEGRELVGRYVFGDYCSGRLSAFRPRPGKSRAGKDRRLRLRVRRLTSFGEDRAGHIYALSQNGPVFRLVARRKHRGG